MTEAEMVDALIPLLRERKHLSEWAGYEDVYGSAMYDGSIKALKAFDLQHPHIVRLFRAATKGSW